MTVNLPKIFRYHPRRPKWNNAYSQYQQAAGNCAQAKTTLDSLKAAETQANDTCTALGTSLSEATEKLNAAKSTCETAQSNAAQNPDDTTLAAALAEAQAAYESAQSEYNTINAQYTEAPKRVSDGCREPVRAGICGTAGGNTGQLYLFRL